MQIAMKSNLVIMCLLSRIISIYIYIYIRKFIRERIQEMQNEGQEVLYKISVTEKTKLFECWTLKTL